MTERWAQPTPGQTVRVTTRFREINYWATTKWKDTTYEGVVGRADRSVPQGSFMLLTPQDPRMPTRVIALSRVIAMQYGDGQKATRVRTNSEVRVWQVQGSKGNVYTVTQRDGNKSCTCPGFQFRKACKHVQ